MIVDQLATMYRDVSRASLTQDVYDFLHKLADLGLIREQG